MKKDSGRERKCFEFVCRLYPKCERAAGSCCALDDFFEDAAIRKEDCYDLPGKPWFREKKAWSFR